MFEAFGQIAVVGDDDLFEKFASYAKKSMPEVVEAAAKSRKTLTADNAVGFYLETEGWSSGVVSADADNAGKVRYYAELKRAVENSWYNSFQPAVEHLVLQEFGFKVVSVWQAWGYPEFTWKHS
jgi:hypothetical protein